MLIPHLLLVEFVVQFGIEGWVVSETLLGMFGWMMVLLAKMTIGVKETCD